MEGALTRGHPVALGAVEAMLRRGVPHAILVTGPGGVGKTTLALDLAAGLLCTAEPGARPCRACRACRMVGHGAHPDLHRLAPDGPGGQIVIGGRTGSRRGVRDLVEDLALMPLEGGARVAIIESAHRLNDDAQDALLKTLEEPPDGVTIVLCADDESRLAPTIRSRCARIRLGPVGVRETEGLLVDRAGVDPPLAARLGRLAGGRPGLALAYALAPDAVRIRGELSRSLLDLVDRPVSARLEVMRTALLAAVDLAAALEAGAAAADPDVTAVAPADPVRAARGSRARPTVPAPPETAEGDAEPDAEAETPIRGASAVDRRRAAEILILVWTEIARDLAVVRAGGSASIHDLALMDELEAVGRVLPDGVAVAALRRLERAGMLIAANVYPELVLDDLAVAWPERRVAA